MHPHRHLRPGLGGQRDLPVDPRGLTPGVALRHLPHADQRVGVAVQHQPLQVPDPGPVLLLRRLEDPLPQPPYPLLLLPPVDPVPPGGGGGLRVRPVLRSVHVVQARHRYREHVSRHRCPTCPSVQVVSCHWSSSAHLPTSARFRARAPGPVSGQLCAAPGGGAGSAAACSRCLSAAGIGFLGILSRQGVLPLLRSAYHAVTSADPSGVSAFRTRETRRGSGALCTPGTTAPTRPGTIPDRRQPPHNGRPLSPRHHDPPRDVQLTRHQQEWSFALQLILVSV